MPLAPHTPRRGAPKYLYGLDSYTIGYYFFNMLTEIVIKGISKSPSGGFRGQIISQVCLSDW